MLNKYLVLISTFLLCVSLSAQDKEKDSVPPAQQDSITKQLSNREIRKAERLARKDSIAHIKKEFNPLAPSKAAFYSAVLPGLGQIYNKRYWKVPLVYGAIGTGLYFYIDNTSQYNRYRDAYKLRLANINGVDEFWGLNADGTPRSEPLLGNDALQDAQEFYQRNKDLSLLITVGLYILNIIDANVDAHLRQYNVNEDLSFKPQLIQSPWNNNTNFGLSLTYNF